MQPSATSKNPLGHATVEVDCARRLEFQTNPLIAAAAGTFAGTVARKLAQDSFLGVRRTELDRQH